MPAEVKPTDFSTSTCSMEATIADKVRYSVAVDIPLDQNSAARELHVQNARELHVQNACSVASSSEVVSELTKSDALELLKAGNNARNAHNASFEENAHNEQSYECAALESTSDSSVGVFTFGTRSLQGSASTQCTAMTPADLATACVQERSDPDGASD